MEMNILQILTLSKKVLSHDWVICQVNIISIISKNLFRHSQLLQIDSEALHTISSLFASHSLSCLFYLGIPHSPNRFLCLSDVHPSFVLCRPQ